MTVTSTCMSSPRLACRHLDLHAVTLTCTPSPALLPSAAARPTQCRPPPYAPPPAVVHDITPAVARDAAAPVPPCPSTTHYPSAKPWRKNSSRGKPCNLLPSLQDPQCKALIACPAPVFAAFSLPPQAQRHYASHYVFQNGHDTFRVYTMKRHGLLPSRLSPDPPYRPASHALPGLRIH
ncbi:hypothetical protein MVEN_00008900 [Mycena venus]|uniref:Uncharacterized protein n=1 Tax=Mycena venus TaxID=2733690 RepID=A0A8H6Z6L2_9AGAR|nr:hypothetical protein MVEN_00008900 [Mycena venus]